MSVQLVPSVRKKSKTVSCFLKKTYEMLYDPNNQSSIKWARSGIGFIVINEDKFSKEVLPKYFKHSNYSSFVRQLNMYNFHKIREGNTESYFHHQHFDRNKKQLLSEIKRKPEKKKRKPQLSSDDEEFSLVKVEEKQRKKSVEEVEKEILFQENLKEQKKIFQNTRHVCGSEQEHQPVAGIIQQRISIKNIVGSSENDDDKLSINNELSERIPRCPTREIFNPSNPNLYPPERFRTQQFGNLY